MFRLLVIRSFNSLTDFCWSGMFSFDEIEFGRAYEFWLLPAAVLFPNRSIGILFWIGYMVPTPFFAIQGTTHLVRKKVVQVSILGEVQ